MCNGDYVFYTIDMLPDEEVLDPASVWLGNDGRDRQAKLAFEAVFHVRHQSLQYHHTFCDASLLDPYQVVAKDMMRYMISTS